MIENMSVVFLFWGIILITLLFYSKDKVFKFAISIPVILLLLSFFTGTVSYPKFEINLLIILGVILLLGYLFIKSNIISVLTFAIVLTIVYVLLINKENLYLTTFNFYPIMFLGIGFNLLTAKNLYNLLLNVLLGSTCLEIINFIYYQNFFNFAGLFNFSFLNFISIFIICSVIVFYICLSLRKIFLRRKSKCIALKSQF